MEDLVRGVGDGRVFVGKHEGFIVLTWPRGSMPDTTRVIAQSAQLLEKLGVEYDRSSSYVFLRIKEASNALEWLVRAVSAMESLVVVGGGSGKEEEELSGEEAVTVDWEKVISELSNVVTKHFSGFSEVVSEVGDALRSNNNPLLLGGPGSGKSFILNTLMELVPSSVYIHMGESTQAAIEDMVINAGESLQLLVIDELDKAPRNTHISPILQLADVLPDGTRVLRVAKRGKVVSMVFNNLRVVAAANPFNPRLRARNWWDALMDRFIPIKTPTFTIEEAVNYVRERAGKSPEWLPELLRQYIDVLSIRRLDQITRLIATNTKQQTIEKTLKTSKSTPNTPPTPFTKPPFMK